MILVRGVRGGIVELGGDVAVSIGSNGSRGDSVSVGAEIGIEDVVGIGRGGGVPEDRDAIDGAKRDDRCRDSVGGQRAYGGGRGVDVISRDAFGSQR